MTTGVVSLFICFAAGAGIGMFYFGGLWWTVTRLSTVQKPWLWTMASFLCRTAVSLAAFYFLMAGHWERLLIALLGFVMVRVVWLRRMRPVTTE